MRVGLDGHFLGDPTNGNGRYLQGLLAGLRQLSRDGIEVIVYAAPTIDGADRNLSSSRAARVLFDIPRAVIRDRLDVFHTQYAVSPFVGRKSCVTIHDAAFARHDLPEYSRSDSSAVRFASFAAKAIIAPSRSAKVDLVNALGVPSGKIAVVPNGCSLSNPTASDAARVDSLLRDREGPFVLHVGRRVRRKRIPLLMQGFLEFRKQRGGTLVLAGPDGDASDEIGATCSRFPEAFLDVGVIPEGVKAALLKQCSALAVVSQYEGFGLPVAEALMAGVPPVISRDPALVDTADEFGIAVDPNPSDIARGLEVL